MVGMLFIRSLKRNLVKPLEEIHSVIQAFRNGDIMRRCAGSDIPPDIKTIFNGINEILDLHTHDMSIKEHVSPNN